MPLEWIENYLPPAPPPRSFESFTAPSIGQQFSNIPQLPSLLQQCKAQYPALALPSNAVLAELRARFNGPATSETLPDLPPRPDPEELLKFSEAYKLLEAEQKDTLKFLQLVEYQVRPFHFLQSTPC